MNQRPALLLLSGGLDSSSLLFCTLASGIKVTPLFIDYGQPTATMEWQAACAVTKSAHIDKPIAVRVENLYRKITPLLRGAKSTSHSGEYFPSRNFFLLSVASIYAYNLDITRILIGFVEGTAQLFPDTSQKFLYAINALIAVEHPHIIVEAPFVTRKKEQIVKEAVALGLPFQVTYSCNFNSMSHCWVCSSCKDRWACLVKLGLIKTAQ
jgi:7-cyano-7-deazaguanine synthase